MLWIVLAGLMTVGAENDPGPEPKHNLIYTEAAMVWDEAFPLGNGLLGALLWGDGAPLKISLDRTDLWDLRPVPEFSGPEYRYSVMQQWEQEKRYKELADRYEKPYHRPGPSKIPAGRITLQCAESGGLQAGGTGYWRSAGVGGFCVRGYRAGLGARDRASGAVFGNGGPCLKLHWRRRPLAVRNRGRRSRRLWRGRSANWAMMRRCCALRRDLDGIYPGRLGRLCFFGVCWLGGKKKAAGWGHGVFRRAMRATTPLNLRAGGLKRRLKGRRVCGQAIARGGRPIGRSRGSVCPMP